MVLKFKGCISTIRLLPGSSLQGTFLGIFLIIIKFNCAYLRPPIPRNLIASTRESISVKFVDNLSLGVHVDLPVDFVQDEMKREMQLNFHESISFGSTGGFHLPKLIVHQQKEDFRHALQRVQDLGLPS